MHEVANEAAGIITRGKALVADDERTNRIMLGAILKQIGYDVIQAENGTQAVDLFVAEDPDIILMDVMMPVMDGYDAVKMIKSIPVDSFTPVIFLTGITGEDDLAKCIEVGGDDFLTKPISPTLLKAKIQSMERFSQLHGEVNRLYARTQQDQRLAESVFARAVVSGNVALNRIHTLLQPAELFSGDVLLTAYTPSGDLNVLMGDFTGHGLAAALGAMPASEVFRAMTGKGYSIQQILSAINTKLLGLLPTGMFMATQFVSISNPLNHASICNCGMPDILLLDGAKNQIKHRIRSGGLPLGISDGIDFNEFIDVVKVDPGDSILLVTDGVTEAINADKEQFGISRLEQAINNRSSDDSAIGSITRSLTQHCGDAAQNDDISLAEIPCTPELLQDINTKPFDLQHREVHSDTISNDSSVDFTLTLHGSRICDADPIPLLINHIQEIDGLGGHRRILYTILTELYTNALDHGVLGMDSSLKLTSDGFTLYFSEREKRLETLADGHIQIHLSSHSTADGGEILIRISDSGKGFDYSNYQSDNSDNSRFFGRGIHLIRELCTSLKYVDPGNQVEAVYSWNKN